MITLNKNQHSLASPVFQNAINSKPVVYSVIENNNDGEIYADSADDPRTAAVILDDIIFIGGKQNKDFCVELRDTLINEIFPGSAYEYYDFYCLADGLRPDIEEVFAELIHGRPVRKTFTFDKGVFDKYINASDKIPDGFVLNRIDESFVKKYGYDQNFLNERSKRFGVALTLGDEIVSECVSVFVGAGQAEISVETNEKYMRRGFALITAAAFIEYCLSLGYAPNWGCWDFREGSAALARRLGFSDNSDEVVYGLINVRRAAR